MSDRFDVTFHPVPEASEQARALASEARFYASDARPGMVSVLLYRGFNVAGGTRLTLEQARDLRDGLTAHLEANAPAVTEAAP